MRVFSPHSAVMRGLVPRIHAVLYLCGKKKSGARNKSGHDGFGLAACLKKTIAALIASVLIFLSPAFAVQPDEMLKDPALEARARSLSGELRCLVCQNQSIDDSDAPLAKDLRLLVRERIVAGDSDAQVKTFLVQRYGEFVLLKPPLSLSTIILWGAPVLLLLAGVFAIANARRNAAPAAGASVALTESEKAALAARLKDRDA